MKYVGPTKKMMKALEDEGLQIEWPKTGNVKDEELLAIEAFFTTGPGWEKCVSIDLRDKCALNSKSGVDNAIAYQLQEAYNNFDVDEEASLYLEMSKKDRIGRGIPDAARLVEDMQEQEKMLKRFADVANAVAEGRKIPNVNEGSDCISIDGPMVENIVSLIEYAMNHGASESQCKPIIDELNRKLGM